MMAVVYVFIGGGLGSVVRFLFGKGSKALWSTDFPIGTLISNLLACLLLGLLVASFQKTDSSWVQPLLIVGFCGGFSTFSTFSNETYELLNNGNVGIAIANILISVLFGVGLIFWLRAKS